MKNIKSAIKKNAKNKNNECLVYIRYTYNRKYILLRTKIYVKPFQFTISTGRVKKSPNYEIKNQILRKKELEIEKICLQLISEDIEPTLFNVKQRYWKSPEGSVIPNNKKTIERKFLTDYQKYADYRKEHQIITYATYQTYITTLNKLKDFQKEKNYLVDYETINSDFYDEFILFLYEKKLMDNSIDKHIKNLKSFMKYCSLPPFVAFPINRTV